MAYSSDAVHEGYISHSKKQIGTLKHSIWQIPFKNMEEVINKTNRYSSLGVSKLSKKEILCAIY